MSLAFVIGVAIATNLGVLAVLLGEALELDLGDPDDSGSKGAIIQYVLIALLALAAVRTTSAARSRAAQMAGQAAAGG